VMHGDAFDMVVKHARWLALLGDTAYDLAIVINRYFNAIRRKLGSSHWSLSQGAKHEVDYISAFEQTLAEEAQRREVDGVICGHTHHAVIHDNFGIRYTNCGDWVESCSALVEHEDGRFEILTWFETGAQHPRSNPRRVEQDEDTEIAAWIEVGEEEARADQHEIMAWHRSG
jgi:UDP-2,3-diacylglucosamine pyrophosphatase LpxH